MTKLISALKRTIAEYGKAPGFKTMRPPLTDFGDDGWETLKTTLGELSLKTPNLDKALS